MHLTVDPFWAGYLFGVLSIAIIGSVITLLLEDWTDK